MMAQTPSPTGRCWSERGAIGCAAHGPLVGYVELGALGARARDARARGGDRDCAPRVGPARPEVRDLREGGGAVGGGRVPSASCL